MAETASDKTKPSVVLLLVCAGLLLVYLAFPTRNYFFDGIAFAQAIEDAKSLDTTLIHPNHLIYEGVGYLFYSLLRAPGLNLRAVSALQILNSILAALSVYVMFLILKASLRNSYLSLCLTLLFAFSATWWKFATDADAYIPAVLFLLISFYLLLPNRKPRPFLVALSFSIAMCFHQLAVVFAPVAMLGLILQTPSGLEKKSFIVGKFLALGLVLTLGAYYSCFYLAAIDPGPRKFLHWMTSFSPDGGFTFNFVKSLSYTLRGHARLFFGGRFNLISGLINPATILLIIAGVVLLVAFAFQVIRHTGKPERDWLQSIKGNSTRRSLLWLCLLWLGCFEVFLFFWMPQHTYYRLFYLPALILVAGLFAVSQRRAVDVAPKFRLMLLVMVVALCNFLFLILPYSYSEKYLPLAFAEEMNQVWPLGTEVFYALPNSDESLIRYFNPKATWKLLDTNSLREFDQELQQINEKGSTAWLETTAIDQLNSTSEGKEWLTAHEQKGSLRELRTSAYNIRFLQITPVSNNAVPRPSPR